jgi:hypothetical protein
MNGCGKLWLPRLDLRVGPGRWLQKIRQGLRGL